MEANKESRSLEGIAYLSAYFLCTYHVGRFRIVASNLSILFSIFYSMGVVF